MAIQSLSSVVVPMDPALAARPPVNRPPLIPLSTEGLPFDVSAPDLFPSAFDFSPATYSGPKGDYSKMSAADQRTVDQAVENVQKKETPREVKEALLVSGSGLLGSGPIRAFEARSAQYRAEQPNKFKAFLGTALMGLTLAGAELETTVEKYIKKEKRPGDRDPNVHPSAVDHTPGRPSGHETGFAAVDFSAMHLHVAPDAELLQEAVNGGRARVVLGLHDESEVAAGYAIGKGAADLIPQRVWDWLAVPQAATK